MRVLMLSDVYFPRVNGVSTSIETFRRELGRLGVTVQSLTRELQEYFGATKGGALVSSVAPDSVAYRAGLKAGDVIVEVGQQEVASPADVAAKVKKAREEGKKSLLFLVDRQGDLRFVAIALGDDKDSKDK